MKEPSSTITALTRARRRALFHLIQAAVEGLKALEALIEEIGGIGTEKGHHGDSQPRQKIEIE